MSAPAQPTPVDLLRVPAGTAAGATVREAGLPGRGEPAAIVVVRDDETRPRAGPRAATSRSPPGGRRHRRGPPSVIRHSARTCWPRRSRNCSPRRSSASGRHHRRLLLRLRRPRRIPPGDLEKLESGCAPSSGRPAVSPPGLRGPRTKPAPSWPASPSSNWSTTSPVTPTSWRSAATSDHRQPQSPPGNGLGRPVPAGRTSRPPATSRPSKLTRSSAAYWRSDQPATPACSASRRHAGLEALDRHLELLLEAQRRDHLKNSGWNWTCSASPTNWVQACRFFHPGRHRAPRVGGTRGASTSTGYEFVNTPAHHQGTALHRLRAPGWYADGMFPPMHIDAEFAGDGALRKPGQDRLK